MILYDYHMVYNVFIKYIFTIIIGIYICKFYLQTFQYAFPNIPKFKIFCTNSLIYKNK